MNHSSVSLYLNSSFGKIVIRLFYELVQIIYQQLVLRFNNIVWQDIS